jgi:hypothetical protein
MINPEKIGEVVGPRGKTINKIIEETGVKIDIEDDGSVFIATEDAAAAKRARQIIEGIAKELQVGDVFTGKVARIMTFGAFVEYAPGKDGMIHISKLDNKRVEKVEDIVNIGDELEVRVAEIDAQGRINLVRNDSWSGSTLCNTGYNGDCSKINSFIFRMETLEKENFFRDNAIDTVFIFGCTNDSWANVELGECMLDSWKEEDLFYVRPAISYFVSTLKKDMPFANIIVVINTQIKQEIQDWLKQVAQYYGCGFVELENIDKQDGHPTAKGMQDISEQIYSVTN